MHNIVLPEPPPNMDAFAPEFCFCGKKTVESHEFWFCSTLCARMDSLRSLDDRECHYRNGVRKAYIRAGVPELYPRRMMSVDQLRPYPSKQRGVVHAHPRLLPLTNPTHQRNMTITRRDAQDTSLPGFPVLPQVIGKALTKKATEGEPLVAERHDRSRWEGFPNAPSRAHRAQRPQGHSFEQISLDVIPFPEQVQARSLRRVPQSSDSLRNNIRKSVVALLNVGRSRKDKSDENSEGVFGHPVNTVIPPVRKESLPSNHQINTPSAIPVPRSRAPRRSASFAGWGPSNGEDPVMHIIEEMREELSGSFDPRSLFNQEEPY